MFTDLDSKVILAVIRESNGDLERAVDSLLNLQAIAQTNRAKAEGASDYHPMPPPPSDVPPPTLPTETQQKRDREKEFRMNDLRDRATSLKNHAVRTLRGNSKDQVVETSPTFFTEFSSIDDQLLSATRENNVAMVKYFFTDLRPDIRRDITPLLTSCILITVEQGNTDLLKLFLDSGAPADGSSTEMTPLILSLESGQLDCCKILIQYCDVNRSTSNLSPLHIATRYGFSDIVKLLLQKGAHANRLDPETGQTALHMAVGCQAFDIAATLLEFRADTTFRDTIMGDTPLHASMRTCKTTKEMMLTCLLMDKAKETGTINAKNNKTGDTCLHIAVERSKKDVYLVDLVLRYQPDPYIKNLAGKTAVDVGYETENSVVIQRHGKDEEEEEVALTKKVTVVPSGLSRSTPNANIPAAKLSVRTPPSGSISIGKNKVPTTPMGTPSTPMGHSIPASSPMGSPRIPASQALQQNVEKDEDYVQVENLKAYIEERINSDGFQTEFQEIEEETGNANLVGDFTSALLTMNLRKNRYKNILPYEHTRVTIETVDGSDFFSANYVNADVPGIAPYIATQGPLQHTAGDFWRMCYEKKAHTVVMLTNEVENGKEKCYLYWPDDDAPLEYVSLVVSKISQSQHQDFVSRVFTIENRTAGDSVTLTQLQYTTWPDQGLPGNTQGFRELVQETLKEDTTRPIVVHCSAGIGRTGVFCVVHSTLAKLNLLLTQSFPVEFNLKKLVLKFREQRAGMVQTQEQYVFCYLSLMDKVGDLLQLLAYKNEQWFHKNLDSNQANQMLQGKSHGTFLFRGSSVPGFIVLSAVSGKNVLHARIGVSADGFEMEGGYFPTLTKLVESRYQVLVHPILRSSTKMYIK
eukprot:TRINITY_DN9599_c0_g1_i3.p1 TRINITY_DN9599_c0_g1~~TRINITY_DN9599_c0_g1_i3.p1  ORF type:complete len:958 (-),score=241.53 TRINITY_DN9599_c0_g1_i3:32-2623(-)